MQGYNPKFIPPGYQSPQTQAIIKMMLQKKMAEEQAAQQGGGSGGGAAGGGLAGAYGLYKLINGGEAATAATSAAPELASAGMSSVNSLPMSTEVMQSLSNGGNGLQSVSTGASTPVAEAGSTMASIAPYLGLASAGLGAYGMYGGIKAGSRKATGMGGAALGGGLAAAAPLLGLGPVGWGGIALAALAGGGAGAMMGHIKTGKSQAQQARDHMRGNIQQMLHLDPKSYNYNGFDFGADGKKTFASTDGGTHHSYELDMSNPLAVSTIPKLRDYLLKQNPNMDDTEQKQTIGMIGNAVTNGAKSQADVDRNLMGIIGGSSPTPQKAAPSMIPRSKTRSPGISNTGQRISY